MYLFSLWPLSHFHVCPVIVVGTHVKHDPCAAPAGLVVHESLCAA